MSVHGIVLSCLVDLGFVVVLILLLVFVINGFGGGGGGGEGKIKRDCWEYKRPSWIILTSGQGERGSYPPWQEKTRPTRHDTTRQDKRQDKRRHDTTRQRHDKTKTRQLKIMQINTRHAQTRQDNVRHDKTRQNTTRQWQNKTRQDKTETPLSERGGRRAYIHLLIDCSVPPNSTMSARTVEIQRSLCWACLIASRQSVVLRWLPKSKSMCFW